jgi:hypothetical protein
MILTVIAAIGLTTAAVAHTPQTPPAAADAPKTTAPVPGANSFTEAQAKDRIEKAGFTSVSDLAKNEDGIWVGTASKGGASVQVMLDYQGNVTSK